MEYVNVDSSVIRQVAYSNGNLYVKFNSGCVYKYERVPMSVYIDFLCAESKGTYLNTKLKKSGYEYRRA